MKKILIFLSIIITFVGIYSRYPIYKTLNSFTFTAGNYIEREVNILQYKPCFNIPIQKKIEEKILYINGDCDKLIINIYYPFSIVTHKMLPNKTIIYDYASSKQ